MQELDRKARNFEATGSLEMKTGGGMAIEELKLKWVLLQWELRN